MDESVTRSPGLQRVLVVSLVLLVVGGSVMYATAEDPQTVSAAGAESTQIEVSTLRIESYAIRPRAEASVMLEPRRQVELFSETSGRVIEVGAEELERVEEGLVLVRLDPLLAKVAVEKAEAAVARSQSELALAQSNLKRRSSLADRKVVSHSALDDAQNAERIASAALRESMAARDEAHDQLEKKEMRAPFSGVLRSFPIEIGEYVRQGEQIAELLDVSTARATVGLADREIVAVRAGESVRLAVEAYPNERFEGKIIHVGAAADEKTKKFPVEVEVPNEQGRLLPGMVARVHLDLGKPISRTVVPRDATVHEFGLRFVFVVVEETPGAFVARRRRVIVRELPFRPAEYEVVEGLEIGEEVATTGIRQLSDGTPVRRRGKRAS